MLRISYFVASVLICFVHVECQPSRRLLYVDDVPSSGDELGISLTETSEDIDISLTIPSCDPTSEFSDVELGISLTETSEDMDISLTIPHCHPTPEFSDDELGISLMETSDNMDISLTIPHCHPTPEFADDEFGLSYGGNTELDDAFSFVSDLSSIHSVSSEDELGISLDHQCDVDDDLFEIRPSEEYTDFENVKAKMSTPRPIKNILSSEVSSGKRMKTKALSIISMKNVLKEKCTCGRQCIKKFTLQSVRDLRYAYWMNSRNIRMQLLKFYLNHSKKSGKFRVISINSELEICSKAFMTVYRINKNTFSKALDMQRRDIVSVPGKKPRDISEGTLMLLNWLEEYATYHGDRMPDSRDILLPYKITKVALFEKYKMEGKLWSYVPVSRTLFYRIWNTHFPHLKIKQTNSFSKCTTCVTLERQLEKTTCIETRIHYRQLRIDHNDRQMNERRYYYSKREASRRYPSGYLSLIIDGMDQSKTNLPHFTGRNPKNINAADLLKTHVTGIINHGHGGFCTYLDINDFPHDPNLTMNILLKSFKRTAEINENRLPPICYIQADNCSRENKNRYVLAFCELLVAERIFNEVHLSFLYVGHTHEDVDAAFSKISEILRTTDAETISELMDLLPKSERISTLFDIKNWLAPQIDAIQGHSEPLHFKFTKTGMNVQAYFKGQHSDPWVELNSRILKSIPSGQPKILYPNYQQIEVDRQLKQIESVKTLFKQSSSYKKWIKFYDNMKTTCVDDSAFILNLLPRQEETNRIVVDTVPPEVRELIQKEIKIPQVIIKKRKPQQRKEQGAKKKQRDQQSKKGPKSQRRRVFEKRVQSVPLTNDIKRHIWLKIFMDLLDTFMITLLFMFIILTYLGLFCLVLILKYLKELFNSLVVRHMGQSAVCHYSKEFSPYYSSCRSCLLVV